MTINEQLENWMKIQIQFYQVLNFDYRYKLPTKKGKTMTIYCGESELKAEVDRKAECYLVFVKDIIRKVTLMEQNRIAGM